MKIDYSEIRMLIESGLPNSKLDFILEKSLYYYCCGKDPTPIISFKSKFPLYVYADIIDYGVGDFQDETGELYRRLLSNSLRRDDVRKLMLPEFKNAELTIWRTIIGKQFALLYVQGDAKKVFTRLYGNEGRQLLPKCICNYRYEITDGTSKTREYLYEIEKKVEYVMGYHYSDSYRKIRGYPYLGDYTLEHKVEVDLYQRI